MFAGLSERVLTRFSRVTSHGRTYVPQLDGFRFIALNWVILFHIVAYMLIQTGRTWDDWRGSALGVVCFAGHVGVDMFFVISGFILVMPFARYYLTDGRPVSIRAYFTRRLTRLEPPYNIHLLITLLLWLLLRRHFYTVPSATPPDFYEHVPSHLLASFFYLHQVIYKTMPLPNLVLWSLEIEIQFYILVPLLALLFAIRRPLLRRTVLAGGIVAGAAVAYFGRDTFFVCHTIAGWLHEFLAGFLLVDLYLTDWARSPGGGYRWDLLSLAGWTGMTIQDWLGSARFLVIAWLILAAYAGSLRGHVIGRVLSNRWLTTIGGMCCTIYMYHGWFILAGGRKTLHLMTGTFWLDVLIQFVILSIFILLGTAPLFLLFERPFMRPDWHTRLWAKLVPARSSRRVEASSAPATAAAQPVSAVAATDDSR